MTWLMAPSSLLPHEGVIELPYPQHRVDFEAELGIVIGKAAKNVSLEDADEYVFGYTTCQDISDRDIQDARSSSPAPRRSTPSPRSDRSCTAASTRTTCRSRCTRTANSARTGRTSEMIFGIREIVSFCSQGTTLLPGDLILTGTPAGVGPIKDGDLLETRIGPFAPLVVRVKG